MTLLQAEKKIFESYFGKLFESFDMLSLNILKNHLTIAPVAKSISELSAFDMPVHTKVDINLKPIRNYQDEVNILVMESLLRFLMSKKSISYRDGYEVNQK